MAKANYSHCNKFGIISTPQIDKDVYTYNIWIIVDFPVWLYNF